MQTRTKDGPLPAVDEAYLNKTKVWVIEDSRVYEGRIVYTRPNEEPVNINWKYGYYTGKSINCDHFHPRTGLIVPIGHVIYNAFFMPYTTDIFSFKPGMKVDVYKSSKETLNGTIIFLNNRINRLIVDVGGRELKVRTWSVSFQHPDILPD